MKKEPTIKDYLKEVGENSIITLDEPPVKVKDTPEYRGLKKVIKQLRKENKRLKKEIKYWPFGAGKNYKPGCQREPKFALPMFKFDGENLLFTASKTEIFNPVAEFKCAKTNKPSKEGIYLCIVSVGRLIEKPKYGFSTIYYSTYWGGSNVYAFTETSPEQILKALPVTCKVDFTKEIPQHKHMKNEP